MPGSVARIVNRRSTYGFVYGDGIGVLKGNTADWRVIRSSSFSFAMPISGTVDSASEVLEYFDGGHANMNGDPIYLYVPMEVSGYTRAKVVGFNNLTGVSLDITAWLIPGNVGLVSGFNPAFTGFYTKIGALVSDSPMSVAEGERFWIHVGTDTDALEANSLETQAWGDGLLIKADPDSDPSAGYWQLGIGRAW